MKLNRQRLIGSMTAALRCGAALSALTIGGVANAQTTESHETATSTEIVVTGTMIRGVAPGGTNVIGVSQESVQETGASTVSQLLQTIPQFGSFNSFQAPIGGGNFQTTNRPNLRNLPGFTTTGSAATLMLVDGHRIVGMGISSTSPDADVIAPGAIERIEIVPDGGSAIYGSDAVAGVINFITRKNVNGVEADARYGFADNYHTFDANLTAGRTWDTGSLIVSYNYSQHDAIFGRDRDYVKLYPANIAGIAVPVTSLECSPGNVQALSPGAAGLTPLGVYGLPYTPATAASRLNVTNQCDPSDFASIYPKEHRHSVFAGLNQQLSDRLEFDVRAFYMNREMVSALDPYRVTTLIAPFPGIEGVAFSPFAGAHNATGGFEFHNVSYVLGGPQDGRRAHVSLETWGITPTFTYDIDGNWRARAMASYGESVTEQHTTDPNLAALPLAIAAGLINPYDPASSDPAAIGVFTNFENFGRAEQQQFNTRLVVDGDLFTLPGGAAKIAAGAEYLRSDLDSQKGNAVPGFQNQGFPAQLVNGIVVAAPVPALPIYKLDRNVKSLFAEVVVPVFGADNATGGLQELTLTAAGRYDKYNDVGDTFNPKFGVTWKPVDWVRLRGAWGKSFAAPSLADSAQADPTSLNWASGATFAFLVPTPLLVAQGYPAPVAGQNSIVLLGSKPGIEPQKATTWSAGVDIDPPMLPGLRLSATYFNIKYKGVIGIPPFTNQSTYFEFFNNSFVVNPTQAQIDAALAGAATTQGSACAPQPSCVYIIQDVRKQNLGEFNLDGIDFSASYATATSFGSIDLNVAGSYELNRKQSQSPTAPLADQLTANNSRLKMRSSVGTNIGNLRAQATWSHSQGYDISPALPVPSAQTKVASFNVIDLFFRYEVPGQGFAKDLSFTLNVNNVFDEDPPVYKAQSLTLANSGFANGATVGRLLQFGVSKKF